MLLSRLLHQIETYRKMNTVALVLHQFACCQNNPTCSLVSPTEEVL